MGRFVSHKPPGYAMSPGALEQALRLDRAEQTAPMRQQVRARSRWLWLVPLMAALLSTFGWVVAHDPGPGLALSSRGWVTVAAAGTAVALLAASRWRQLALAPSVALVTATAVATMLLTTPAPQQKTPAPAHPPKHKQAQQAQALEQAAGCPAISEQPLAWARCAWKAAGTKAKRSPVQTNKENR